MPPCTVACARIVRIDRLARCRVSRATWSSTPSWVAMVRAVACRTVPGSAAILHGRRVLPRERSGRFRRRMAPGGRRASSAGPNRSRPPRSRHRSPHRAPSRSRARLRLMRRTRRACAFATRPTRADIPPRARSHWPTPRCRRVGGARRGYSPCAPFLGPGGVAPLPRRDSVADDYARRALFRQRTCPAVPVERAGDRPLRRAGLVGGRARLALSCRGSPRSTSRHAGGDRAAWRCSDASGGLDTLRYARADRTIGRRYASSPSYYTSCPVRVRRI